MSRRDALGKGKREMSRRDAQGKGKREMSRRDAQGKGKRETWMGVSKRQRGKKRKRNCTITAPETGKKMQIFFLRFTLPV
jgi:hypothetical protein